MGGLALSIDRRGIPHAQVLLRALVAAAPHRSTAGTREAAAHSATAAALLGSGSPSPAVATSPDGATLVVADARLDNHRELASQLSIDPATSTAELLLAAYRRWELDTPASLVGDFAFALWDGLRQRLVAARDPFGIRPLFFKVEPSRILVASEVEQILAVPGMPPRLNEAAAIGSLAGINRPGWTFYQGVQRLPPGHVLQIAGSSAQTRRFWPPPTTTTTDPPEQLAARLRHLLAQSTRDRIQQQQAPGLLLSGGIDSTSVAATAGALRAEQPALPLLQTFSFAHTAHPQSDERSISDLVAASAGLPNVAVPTDHTWPLANGLADVPPRDSPFRLFSHLLLARSAQVAGQHGVTTLMTGHRADALLGRGTFDYLGRLTAHGPRATWLELEAHHQRTGISRRSLARHYLLQQLPVAIWPAGRAPAARAHLRRILGRGHGGSPAWLRTEALHRYAIDELPRAAIAPSSLHGHGRRQRYAAIVDDQDARAAEAMELTFARAGLQYADPWADRRLAEFILSIPPYRTTRRGQEKWLTAEAMRGLLPELARTRPHPATPTPFYQHGLLDHGHDIVPPLFQHSKAAALGLVDEALLSDTYRRMVARDPDAMREFNHVWRFVNLETWLRCFHG